MNAAPAAVWEGRSVTEWRHELALPDLIVHDEVGSTNDVARAHAAAGAPAGLLVLAEHQTAGRGRLGRRWLAAPGSSLLMSFLLRPARSADPAPGTAPLRVGMAVARALHTAADIAVRLKWPNDLLVPGRGKLGGILCEATAAGAANGSIVAGIGINVRPGPPAPADASATAVDECAGAPVSRAALLRAIVEAVRPLFAAPLVPLTGRELDEFARIDALRGRAVTVHDGTGFDGVVRGVHPDGALLVEHGGVIRRITSASIRAAGAPAGRMPSDQPATRS